MKFGVAGLGRKVYVRPRRWDSRHTAASPLRIRPGRPPAARAVVDAYTQDQRSRYSRKVVLRGVGSAAGTHQAFRQCSQRWLPRRDKVLENRHESRHAPVHEQESGPVPVVRLVASRLALGT